MPSMVKKILRSFTKISAEDKKLISAIFSITGKAPRNPNLYKIATKHSSVAIPNFKGHRESNDRMEYLGDAILGAVVADYLFTKFPFKDQGFLTDIRSRIVNREAINTIGEKIGIERIIQYNQANVNNSIQTSLYGDALEALIGAIYLDRGYNFCNQFIIHKLIIPHFNMEEVVKSNPNHKSRILEWAQKGNKTIRFEILDITTNKAKNENQFTAQVFVNDKPMAKGHGLSKKKAEQDAAQKSWQLLELN